MGKLQKTRDEIETKYTWDLTLIYKTDAYFEKDYERVSKEINDITRYKGILVKNASNLLGYLKLSNELERKLYKLYYYANLKNDQDTTNTKYQAMLGKVKNLLTKFEELDAYAQPELMSIDYSIIEKYYEEEKELKEYEFVLSNLFRFKKHILSKEVEEVLSSLSNSLNNSSETYELLTDSDMKFGKILDENNEEVELTESNYSVFLHSKDRRVRKEAFNKILTTYGEYKNTISSTFAGNVDTLTTLAKLKKYDSSLEAALFSDNVDKEVYNNLIKTVKDNLNVLYKYFKLKKDFLKLDEFHLYDQYVDLVEENTKQYTFLEAKDLVIEALSVLGEDYIKNLNKAFDERWIDVYNNKGKRGGAYSSGFYDTKPYVLLNYEGTINDVSTLAHELGHSMHTYYSCLNNPYQYSSYKIFVAEVASTVNELLLNFHLLNKGSKEDKKYILSNLMNLFKATIYRQTMFAEFERDMHNLKEQGGVLTNEVLCDNYYKLNLDYFGPDVVVDDEIKYEWERIPHFYYNFYVYKYAIGLSCACYIVDNILNKKEYALENYLKFLSSGGSDYPINELKIAGIDVTKKDVIESAIKMFDNFIEQFKELM
ncbi:MAG TPA: oligoendopeptidase F [Candidatus Faecisoma merdavium]|nr:oligoendopeptidase F [Candidatus Faecisoma merdavium]